MQRAIRNSVLAITVLLLSGVGQAASNEIGYVEDFALSADRAKALEQLIPGTEAYYYYHSLHQQHLGNYQKVDQLVGAWIKKHGETGLVRQITNRQILFKYNKDQTKQLELLRQRLGIHFNHQRERLHTKPNFPVALDQKIISRETLSKRALAGHRNTVNGFEDRAFDWLIATDLDPARRRNLLTRLRRPDYPNLTTLIHADLKYKGSRGFGSLNIHRQLLRSQLDDLLKRDRTLLNNSNFVNIYLTRLQPGPDDDWQRDPKARLAYLERMWSFVSGLAPVFNSLKAHVLYQRLEFDRSQGVFDKNRFMTYIKLPRNINYVEPRYLGRDEHRRYHAQLGANYQSQTLLPPIRNDEQLVRSYLEEFFVKETSYKPYTAYIRDTYLKEVFASTKILNGIGDMEQWHALLTPSQYQALKERVEIGFSPANDKYFDVAESVKLDVDVKNVDKLIVKVFRINNLNYYLAHGREVNTDINLDGLVANDEKTYTYELPPLRRKRHTFTFSTLKERGTYVVEFIGNGKSSRALVRKGRLQYLVEDSSAGHVFKILDEGNNHLPDATLYVAGHHYKPDKSGEIVVPYSARVAGQQIILVQSDFASLDRFTHNAESYQFTAGFFVDREALLRRSAAGLVIRAGLAINGKPAPLALLENVRLTITSVDREGVSSTATVNNFKLQENAESIHEFNVPDRMVSIHFALHAQLKHMSQNRKIDVGASANYQINAIDGTEKTFALHLLRTDKGYAIDVLGKSGESKADRPMQLGFKHRDFRDQPRATLKTDERGRVTLGDLKDIDTVTASGPDGQGYTWRIGAEQRDHYTYPTAVHASAGSPVMLPYVGSATKVDRSEFSLLATKAGAFVADHFSAMRLDGGYLVVDDLPAGDYSLLLKDTGTQITLRFTKGTARDGFVLGKVRHLQTPNRKPMHLAGIDHDSENVTIRLANANPHTRVHVFATRYVPRFSSFGQLGKVSYEDSAYQTVPFATSRYMAGRQLGDEYRYILERKYHLRYPGNMLERPELLLNPWAIRTTQTQHQSPQAGTVYGRGGEDKKSNQGHGGRGNVAGGGTKDFANLDFLAEPATVLVNLLPDKNGVIELDRKLLGSHHHLHVVAADDTGAVHRELPLTEGKGAYVDLRLVNGLDPEEHFTEQKQISVVNKGGKFVLDDVTTSKFETYDTLGKVYSLFTALNTNANLSEFRFVLNWPKLKPEEKREKYSKYACHELSFFIYKKDRKFFNQVVKPYLTNKKDKTFLDQWLLEEDLAAYLDPWKFAQLNMVERSLLGQRLTEAHSRTSRHVGDQYDLVPPNIELYNHLFRTALKGSALVVAGENENGDDAAPATPDDFKRPSVTHAVRGTTASGLVGGRGGGGGAFGSANGAVPGRQNGKSDGYFKAKDQPGSAFGPGADRHYDGERLAKIAPDSDSDDRPADASETRRAREYKKGAEKKQVAAELQKNMELLQRLGDQEMSNRLGRELERRQRARQLYQKLEKTKEWVENNYYKLPIAAQNAGLVPVSSFWRDFAAHDGRGGFYSSQFAYGARNFTEMMFALAVLDLPFEAGDHKSKLAKQTLTIQAATPMVVFHKEVKQAKMQVADVETPILVSQNFFRHGDRYQHVNNERYDKFVTEEFLTDTVYGCQVVVTNPTSARQKLDVLLQIPRGAVPVLGTKYTRSVHIDLQPYNTKTLEYFFYFPAAGQLGHYPVHVAKNEELIAFVSAFNFNVVDELSKVDTESWDYVSQHGSTTQVIDFLKAHNLGRINLARIAWRMQDKAYFAKVAGLLRDRLAYDSTLWSYSIKHNERRTIREYLRHANGFLNQCGPYIDTTLVKIDPIERRIYEHMEYKPLVNARAHQLGKRRRILNDAFNTQYHRFMSILAYRPKLDSVDRMSATYYLLLQDRVDEGVKMFKQIDRSKLATQLQYDYFDAYVSFYTEDLSIARRVTSKYADHPVDRWRERFGALKSQLDEIEGKSGAVADDENRQQVQDKLAATAASFDFEVDAKQVKINYQNIDKVTVNYYLMDIELLFSRQPFVQQYSDQFSYIRPNETEVVELAEGKTTHAFDLPRKLRNRNVMIEIVHAGRTKVQPYFSNALSVQLIENYGQVRVAHRDGNEAYPKVYVKVYARMNDGRVRFYKDGYTDLRGRFDYTSLNTDELNKVEKFSILILSDDHGAVVREALPPKR